MDEAQSAALLGLVEGLTEFLPVSSTGHLLLAEHFLRRQSDLFNTAIQSGAVTAVLLVFYRRVWSLCTAWRDPQVRTYLLQLALAFGITAVGGLALKKAHFKLPETTAPVAWATLVGGVLFLAVEWWLRSRPQQGGATWATSAAVGAGQLVAAVFPGASRSGITILFALMLGMSRPAAAEFSFLLGIPTLLAAGAVQAAEALHEPNGVHENWGLLCLAAAIACVAAFAVVRWLLRFVQTHTFAGFGIYRIVLGTVMLFWG